MSWVLDLKRWQISLESLDLLDGLNGCNSGSANYNSMWYAAMPHSMPKSDVIIMRLSKFL